MGELSEVESRGSPSQEVGAPAPAQGAWAPHLHEVALKDAEVS